jgi:hypothetical protein
MPRIQTNVNLSDVDESRKVLTPGWYRARVKGAEIKTSKNADQKTGQFNQYINWQLETEACDNPDDNEMTLFYNTTFTTDGGLKQVKRFLKAIGLDWDADGFDTEDALGLELEVNVSVDEYPKGSGEMSNQVKGVRPL